MSGFSLGSSGDSDGLGKSLDDIIADRRMEQSRTSLGRGGGANNKNNNKNNTNNQKKNELVNRSIATGRAKRTAAVNNKRGLSTQNKPSAMQIDQEVYRQSRNTNASKRNQEQKLSNGRLPPNSSLRDKKKKQKDNSNAKANATQKTPSKKQLNAAVQGMKNAGYCVPDGYTMTMQFIPNEAATTTGKGKGKGGQQQQNHGNNNNRGDRSGGDRDRDRDRGGSRGGTRRGNTGGRK
mmetsp:Transcript_43397/g.48603  ORF Transcript_43397/g.48603 Transcript_43397/m.48603 type:complete len:236 (+) Transcript_43397:97-804(+)